MPKQPKRKGPKKARVWFHVVPRGTGKAREWAVLRNAHAKGQRGMVQTVEATKKAALTAARDEAKMLWADCAQPCQVVIHGIDGTIKADATFGHDPKRSRG